MKLSELLEDRDRVVNRHTIPVLMSTDAAQACALAQENVDKAREGLEIAEAHEAGRMAQPRTERGRKKLAEAEAELAKAYEQARPHLVDFVVESIGSDEWEELLAAHQPTDEQIEKAAKANDRRPEYNEKTFPLAAIAACLREPEVASVDEVRELKSKIPDVVWQQLFAGVLRANRGANRVPLSLSGSDGTPSSEEESLQQ